MSSTSKHAWTELDALLTELQTTIPVAIHEVETDLGYTDDTLDTPASYVHSLTERTHYDWPIIELSTEGTAEEDLMSTQRDTIVAARLAMLFNPADGEPAATRNARLYGRALDIALHRAATTVINSNQAAQDGGLYWVDTITNEPEEWQLGEEFSRAAVVRADLHIRTTRVES